MWMGVGGQRRRAAGVAARGLLCATRSGAVTAFDAKAAAAAASGTRGPQMQLLLLRQVLNRKKTGVNAVHWSCDSRPDSSSPQLQ